MKNVKKLSTGDWKKIKCPTCKNYAYNEGDAITITLIGECSICDHVRGSIEADRINQVNEE